MMRLNGLTASNMRWSFAALGALVLAFGVPSASRAGAPALSITINFADYGNFISELDIGTVPAGTYNVSMSSTVPIALFDIENSIYFSGSSYYPNGNYMGGDEGVENQTAFDVDPQALGKPYADTELAVVPPTEVFNEYYPGGQLESSYTDTVIGELLTLATYSDDGGTAVVTFSAVPEPKTWFMTIAGFFALGLALRLRGQAFRRGRLLQGFVEDTQGI